MIDVDVYSDLSCPWCYVGKRRLDKAIKQFTAAKVCVNWHPYIIDKNTAPEGEEYMVFHPTFEGREGLMSLESFSKCLVWGGDGWTHSLRSAGQKDGLEFKNWKTWPNSLNGHRLIHLAGVQKGAEGQGQAKDVLFRMIYEDGMNISDVNTLTQAAKELGLQGAEDYLKSTNDVDFIWSEDLRAKTEMRISGVPYFVISNDGETKKAMSMSGAQGTEQFLAAFHRVSNH